MTSPNCNDIWTVVVRKYFQHTDVLHTFNLFPFSTRISAELTSSIPSYSLASAMKKKLNRKAN